MRLPAELDRSATVALFDRGARLVEGLLHDGGRLLGRAELRVHAWRAGRDPSTGAWADDVRRRAADGTLYEHEVDMDLLAKRFAARS